MKIFKDLIISGKEDDLRKFEKDLPGFLPSYWKEKESKDYPEYLLFDYYGKLFPDAQLVILKEINKYKVVNIFPLTKQELSYDEYNGILELFFNNINRDNYPKLLFDISSSDELRQQDILKDETINALRKFADTANKSTGSSHPSDMKAWCNFLCTIFRNNDYKKLSEYYLKNFLVEDYKWPPDKSDELVIEYSFAIELLSCWETF